MNNKVLVNFCPTGMIPQKGQTPFVPISPQEIIEQTHEAYELGITIAHLHAREKNGVPTYKKSIYQEIFEGVRKYCPDLIICGSTSGRNFPEFEKRSEVIELKPDMCSLTLSSLNFLRQASVNAPEMIISLAEKMNSYGVVPELEAFDLGMINYGNYLIKKKVIQGPIYWNLLFGNIAGYQASLAHIGQAIQEISQDNWITLAGLGEYQLQVNSIAIAMGYGVRIGLEDNIYWDSKKSRLCSNVELVKRIHDLIEMNGKEFLKPKEMGELGFYNSNRLAAKSQVLQSN
ncbi:3-keto-5-aminohexanoate cleavage protein [Algoriphagus vanfongensis]|uniref:3-keto-5-aminohexanoate cleavage protein n=1 Tax=Algoriphagus vanfongensis TaxID=426371 RepID=UPI0004252E73|nr:3-keto-5-aminohexanoate cleavage protein [Algoriphagus vanfongensis]